MLLHDLHGDYECLGQLLQAAIPAGWPPALLDREALELFVAMATEHTDPHFCSWYWVGPGPAGRTLIGSGGTGSCQGSEDSVMIGYSVVDEFQKNGFATEAIRGLVPAIFAGAGIRRIIATTYPDLNASIRVLEKCGFSPAGETGGGEGMEEGTVMYILEK